jgi:hypothetical protein
MERILFKRNPESCRVICGVCFKEDTDRELENERNSQGISRTNPWKLFYNWNIRKDITYNLTFFLLYTPVQKRHKLFRVNLSFIPASEATECRSPIAGTPAWYSSSPGLNVLPKTSYTDWKFRGCRQSLQVNVDLQREYMTAYLCVLRNSWFTYRHIISYYKFCSSSLNKLTEQWQAINEMKRADFH